MPKPVNMGFSEIKKSFQDSYLKNNHAYTQCSYGIKTKKIVKAVRINLFKK